jgi:glycosyltransferase involved in cell wall biosynthesis
MIDLHRFLVKNNKITNTISKMKIAIDLRGLNYQTFTGVNNYTIRLLQNLPTGHSYTLVGLKVVSKEKLFELVPMCRDFSIISMSEYYNSKKYFNSTITSALSILKMNIKFKNNRCKKFDLLILPQPKAIQIHPSTKLITVFHDLFGVTHPEYLNWKHRIVENLKIYEILAKHSDTIITNSHATALDISRYFPELYNKISIIYPASLVEKSTKQLITKSPVNSKYILVISGIEPRKNWDNIIYAYLQSNLKQQGVKLIMIGKPTDKRYLQHITKIIKKHDEIQLILNCDQGTKIQYLKNSEFLVYTSFYEGFGFPILEAHEFNKPVLTSRVSSMPEIAGEGGVYCNPFDIQEIANGMKLLTSNKEFYQKISDGAGRNKKRFDWLDFKNNLNIVIEKYSKIIPDN